MSLPSSLPKLSARAPAIERCTGALLALAASASLCWRPVAAANAPPPAAQHAPAIVLLLPAQSTPYADAARAVRAGFLAARDADDHPGEVQVVETDESQAQLDAALAAARAGGARIVVGPLTRSAVTGLVDRDRIVLPTLTLNLAERDTQASPTLLEFSLAAEAEAPYVVGAAAAAVGAAAGASANFLIIAGAGGVEQRTAAAFEEALDARHLGYSMVQAPNDGEHAQHLAATAGAHRYDAYLLALDIRHAVLVRPQLGADALIFASSEVNPGDTEAAVLGNELNGIRFVDMPWMVEPDHPAVMVYARPQPPDPVALSANLQRLYGFGIDAYRLAVAWLAGRTFFDLDGVSGQLHVDRARGPRVERVPAVALFRNGRVEVEPAAGSAPLSGQ